MTTSIDAKNNLNINHDVAFNLGNDILEKWGCSPSQKQTILGIPKSAFDKYLKNAINITLKSEQLERLSYIANIHSALRTAFSNRDNVYKFMSMINYNPHFDGKTPLSLISSGDADALRQVFEHIESMTSFGDKRLPLL